MAFPLGFIQGLHELRVEPVKRMVGGSFGWAVHRFPIKGGISVWDASHADLRESMSRMSTLYRRFSGKVASK